ncbi:unnamed protein product [Camellia sinensis]
MFVSLARRGSELKESISCSSLVSSLVSLAMETNSLEHHQPSDSPKPSLDQEPSRRFWDILDLHKWEGFWYSTGHLEGTKDLQAHHESRDDDIVLASSIKTGTTWLKALCFCIMQGQKGADKGKVGEKEEEEDDPLLKNHPTFYVQTIESKNYEKNSTVDLSGMPSPRLFHTHIPYNALPESMKKSNCKIVYITRNPKDTLVSMWHFLNNVRTPEQGPYPFDKAFESFCDGVHPYGPFFDHVLEYWKESLKKPEKILFLRYEEMKRDPKEEVKKLASFLGRPFANDKELEKVLWRCSLDRLKNLEVNKNGLTSVGIPKSSFFRLGVVGDWKNNLSNEMQEKLDQMTKMKLDQNDEI